MSRKERGTILRGSRPLRTPSPSLLSDSYRALEGVGSWTMLPACTCTHRPDPSLRACGQAQALEPGWAGWAAGTRGCPKAWADPVQPGKPGALAQRAEHCIAKLHVRRPADGVLATSLPSAWQGCGRLKAGQHLTRQGDDIIPASLAGWMFDPSLGSTVCNLFMPASENLAACNRFACQMNCCIV